MSPLKRDNLDPSNPLYYAPPRLRGRSPETETDQRDEDEGQGPLAPGEARKKTVRLLASREEPRRQSRIFDEAVNRALQESLEPEAVLAPPVLSRRADRSSVWGLIGKFALAVAAAAVVALFFVTGIPFSRTAVKPGDDGASMASMWQSLKALLPAAPHKPVSTLVVNDASGTVNEPLQLAIRVTAPDAGASVTLRGLPPDARLTVGKRISVNEWRIPAREVSTATVIPPDDFTGQITVAAELRSDDGDALVASSMHLAWAPATPPPVATRPQQALPVAPVPPRPAPALPQPAPAPVPSTSTMPPPLPVVRNLNPKEISAFLNRAQNLIASGDLQSARLLLRRAAEAQDARAAFALAQTYDPVVLKRYGPSAPAAEVATARNWYERAREWGSPDAQRQLDALEDFAR